MLKVCSIASGSKGNCIYVASQTTKLLIDCGICLKEITKRLEQIGVKPNEINAILLTHEHGDHICGVDLFVKNFGIPVYVHKKTSNAFAHKLKLNTMKAMQYFTDDKFTIGDITIDACELSHDSAFCFGYAISCNGSKAAIATDLGCVTPEIINFLSGSQLVFLESNHCTEMLSNNDYYPLKLKRRILSNRGHLSNKACAEVVYSLVQNNCGQIVLSHLSEKNNHPMHAYNTIKKFLESKGVIEGVHVAVDVALQDRVGTVFLLD
ncbi:MAG: MBL fold metallo-hydrolase [Firmicutes bacterium]|nr:MBL fold metallo-hydrolase [Bacillota bacterium]